MLLRWYRSLVVRQLQVVVVTQRGGQREGSTRISHLNRRLLASKASGRVSIASLHRLRFNSEQRSTFSQTQ